METIDIISRIDLLAEQRDYLEETKAIYAERINALITPDIQAQIQKLEEQRDVALSDIQSMIGSIEEDIKAEVLTAGKTIKGARLQAIWSKGRDKWNTKLLDGYAIVHPEILAAKETGEPTVSFRKV